MTATTTREMRAEIANPDIRQLLAPQNRPLLETLITEARPMPSPVCLTVDLTHRCNGRCGSCIERQGMECSQHADLPAEVALRLVRESAEAGVKAWGLYGGEPLLHPAFAEVLLAAAEESLALSVVTNGMLLGRRSVAEALRRAAATGRLQSVRVSLNAGTPAVHARHFGVSPRRFEPTVAACRELVQGGVPLSVSYLVDADNHSDLLAGARVALEGIGARRLQVRPATGLHGVGPVELTPQARAGVLRQLRAAREEWGTRLAVPASFVDWLTTQRSPDTDKQYRWCAFCGLRAVVTPPGPGRIWACTYFRGVGRFAAGTLPLLEWVRSTDRRRALEGIRPREHCGAVACNKHVANQWLHGLRAQFARTGRLPALSCVPSEAPFFFT